ncbi:type VI secretion system baseplate subunit TssE [soil metagenome]|nr:type VI secretion system baseplate subunit TssE [Gemmatimonadota bacterium]
MAREAERTVRQTVLDRLLDDNPSTGSDPAESWSESVSRMKESLLRDLEWLLNTRRSIVRAPENCPEVNLSVHTYGLPDVSSLSGDSDATREVLLRELEETIELFEPRLMQVRISATEGEDSAQRRIRFVIEGLMRMDPNPERVLFDTVLELSSGKIFVGGDANA